jgi:glycosyltransferase involved in cell wall biosynthesis
MTSVSEAQSTMNRPLRFCMLTTFYPPYNFGGDGIFVQRLANALAERGHQVAVIHCRDAYRLLARQEPNALYADHPNVTVYGLESPWGVLSPLTTHQTGWSCFKATRVQQILTTGFDVIHYHNISLLGPQILSYGRGLKLYTMHEYWLLCPTHTLFRFNAQPCVRPHCFTCTLTYKRPPQWWRSSNLLPTAIKHVDTFLAPSRFCQRLHLEWGFEAPIVHLPNFVPTVELASQAAGPPAGAGEPLPYFLYVGRLEKLKGLHTLMPFFQRYDKAQLWIAGTGTYETQLRRLAAGCSNIRFLGQVAAEPLQKLYRQAIALLVPSLWYEIFPLVILEAFRQQTPVIARNLGSMAEVLGESGGGFVYTSDQELLTAMEQLITAPAYRHALGLRGYQAYQRLWTVDAHLEQYFAVIAAAARTSAI